MKRFGSTLISLRSARVHRFQALVGGSPEADYSGECQRPVIIPVTGVRDKTLAWVSMLKHETDWPGTDYAPGFGWVGDQPETRLEDHGAVCHAFIKVRCRKCPWCLEQRQRLWAARAQDELRMSHRTWFGTITLAPDHAFRARLRAERRLALGGTRFDQLDSSEQFLETAREVQPELTRWLKRVRKASGARLRYLLVCESHKSGVPHWHILLHEREGKVSKRTLEGAWHQGSTQFRIADGDGAVRYVCKYVAKSALTRVRASKEYGKADKAFITERVGEIVNASRELQRALAQRNSDFHTSVQEERNFLEGSPSGKSGPPDN